MLQNAFHGYNYLSTFYITKPKLFSNIAFLLSCNSCVAFFSFAVFYNVSTMPKIFIYLCIVKKYFCFGTNIKFIKKYIFNFQNAVTRNINLLMDNDKLLIEYPKQ